MKTVTISAPGLLEWAEASAAHVLIVESWLGLEVCRAVRTDPSTANVPVLMVSALPFTDDVAAGMAAGADDYVIKPFETAELVARAAALLSRIPGP